MVSKKKEKAIDNSNENQLPYLIKVIINQRAGEYWRIFILFVFAPFIYPTVESLMNYGLTHVYVLPASWGEFLIIELCVLIILMLRLIRDFRLRNIISPNEKSKKNIDRAISKLKKIKKIYNSKDAEFNEAVDSLINLNISDMQYKDELIDNEKPA